MMNVDKTKCIGCGECVKDCFPSDIVMDKGKAFIKNVACFKCGHCIAVCPVNAISTDEYNMEEVKEYSEESFKVDAENLLNFIKFRRTVRRFKSKDVEAEKLLKIIEAERFTQTASNLQDVSFIVVKDKLNELKDLTYDRLKSIAEHSLASTEPTNKVILRYANMWLAMHKEYKAKPSEKDKLFFNAPIVIIVTAKSQVNGTLASSNMELMTNALGLGTLFSGFLVRAANGNKEIHDLLEIKEGKEIVTCMVIGYPDVEYKRTVPRKAADISWK